MAEIWEEWGNLAYLGVFLWAFLEGETFVIAAAAVGAATGIIDPLLLMIAAWTGSFAGDQCWFLLGKHFGPRVLARMPKAKAQFAKAAALLHRYGAYFVLSFRFLYGIRNVAAAACGMAGMRYRYFAILNFIGAGVWAGSFVAAGWFLGGLIGVDNIFWAIGAIAFSVLGFFVVRWLLRRRRAIRAGRVGSGAPLA